MNKQQLVTQLIARRAATGLSNQEVAERSGLTERSVRNALGAGGNPQLSSLLALVDALGLELQLVPRGFGALRGYGHEDDNYRPVATRVSEAISRSPFEPVRPPVAARRKRKDAP